MADEEQEAPKEEEAKEAEAPQAEAGNGDGAVGVLKAVGNVDVGTYGALSAISIPQHAFSVPRGANKNRGRGFALDLTADG